MDAKLHLGHLGLIKPEVDLIRTILRTSSRLNNSWQLVDSGECDAILAYNAEKSLVPFVLKQNTQLIMIKRRGEAFSGYAFYKPFRADELIDTLILIQSNFSARQPANTVADETPFVSDQQTIYSLKKWPPASLLSRHKNYTLLSVYLSRGTKTLRDLVTLSGHSENFCMQFLSLLEQHQLLNSETSRPNMIHERALESAPKKNFFSLLRARLGLNRTQ